MAGSCPAISTDGSIVFWLITSTCRSSNASPAIARAAPLGVCLGVCPASSNVADPLPGAISLPHTTLVLSDGRNVVDRDIFNGYLEQVDRTTQRDQIAFCNAGHWASVGWFLLSDVGGNPNVSMYDGSPHHKLSAPLIKQRAGGAEPPAQSAKAVQAIGVGDRQPSGPDGRCPPNGARTYRTDHRN